MRSHSLEARDAVDRINTIGQRGMIDYNLYLLISVYNYVYSFWLYLLLIKGYSRFQSLDKLREIGKHFSELDKLFQVCNHRN